MPAMPGRARLGMTLEPAGEVKGLWSLEGVCALRVVLGVFGNRAPPSALKARPNRLFKVLDLYWRRRNPVTCSANQVT